MSKSSIQNTLDKKRAFLERYPDFLRATKTANAVGINNETHYDWLKTDEGYNKQFQALKKRIDSDRLEENLKEVHRRGLEKSDLLLMFETKALAPEIYREKVVTGPLIGDIKIIMAIPGYDESLRLTDGNTIEGEIVNATEQGEKQG